MLTLLALSIGCVIDSNLNQKEEDQIIDTGEELPDFDTDTEDTDTEDTDTDVPDPPVCGDQYWAAKSIAQLEECYSEPTEVGTFTPEVMWTRQTFTNSSGSVSCMMQPIVCSLTDDDGDGDMDEDDTPDVVIITYSPGVLRALNGDDGTELWGTSGGGSIQITGGAACGDIDNDGTQEVIAATSSGVQVFDNEGTSMWSVSSCSGAMDGTSDAPGIFDLDGDGNPEIIIGSCVIDNTGDVVGKGTSGYGSSSNVGSAGIAADVDLDGDLEVIGGNAIYEMDGTTIWSNGERDGYPAVGNFDADDFPEFVITGDATLRVQDDDGTVLCRTTIPMASSSYGGPPTVADFDGDGAAEIGVAANSTYTVFESDCSVLWQYTGTTDPSSGNTGSAVFDFEGDGVADVVYADERWVWVFDGRDGTVKMQDTSHSNNTWLEYPTIADINADDSADIAVCNTPGSWGSQNGVTVFQDAGRSWRKGRRIWNQHGYSITNVEDDGSIPTYPDPNWLTYNNFRSGDLTPGQGYAGPDLFVNIQDVCIDECDRGNLTVWITVGNQGYTDVVDPVGIEIYGKTDGDDVLLGYVNWTAAVAQATESESYAVELTGVPTPLYDIYVAIDGGEYTRLGIIDECYEDNNVTLWGAYTCL
jgi:hypothetical protein